MVFNLHYHLNAPTDPEDERKKTRKDVAVMVLAALLGGVASVILNRVTHSPRRSQKTKKSEKMKKKKQQEDSQPLPPFPPVPMTSAVIGTPLVRSRSDNCITQPQADGASTSGVLIKVTQASTNGASKTDEESPGKSPSCSQVSEDAIKKVQSMEEFAHEDLTSLNEALAGSQASEEIARIAAEQAKKKCELLKAKAKEVADEAQAAAEEAQLAFEEHYESEMTVKRIELKIRALQQDGTTPSYIS